MSSVEPQTPYNEYTGNGVSTVFPYEFQLLASSDLVVTIDGVLVPTSEYLLTGVGEQDGGDVIFTTAPLSGAQVLLTRTILLRRDIDYQYNGELPERIVDLDFNRIWQALQGFFAVLGGAVRAPFPEQIPSLPNAAARANALLGFDANGDPIVTTPNPSDATAVSLALAQLIANLANTSNPVHGDALLGVKQPFAGSVAMTQHAKNQQVVDVADFGAVGDNATDNTAAFAAAVAWANSLTPTATAPRIRVRSGIYRYATSPNWAVQHLVLDCEPGAIFRHTGAGVAFNCDGGAAGAGVYRVRVLGGLKIQGNALTTDGLYSRAMHHCFFDVAVRDVSQACVHTLWNVCSEFRVRASPVGDPAFNPQPVTGILLDARNALELTSACKFDNPIIEGVSSYGINLANAIQNTFIGGTSESNGSGVFVSGTSSQNTFINLDCEFNTTADIICQGLRNTFINILSDKTCTFAGLNNLLISGNYNTILAQGSRNEYQKVQYGSNFGLFTDTSGSSIKKSVYNLSTNLFDDDVVRMRQRLTTWSDNGAVPANNFGIASMDQLNGGATTDQGLWKYGTGQLQFWCNSAKNLSLGPNTMGFYGTTPVVKPTVTGAKGGNLALASLVTQLANLGLITDSTT